MLAFLMIALIPFLQLGITYYFSISTILFSYFIISSDWKGFVSSKKNIVFFIFTSIFSFSLLGAGGLNNGFLTTEHLRVLREVVFFILIVCVLYSGFYWNEKIFKKVLNFTLIVSTLIFFLICIQSIFLLRGQYFGIPEVWYVMNAETIPDELDLIYSKIRPSATFGEPSYLSTYCLIVLIGLFGLINNNRKVFLIVCLLIMIILMSFSMMGMVFLFIFIFFNYLKSKVNINKKILFIFPLIFISAYIVFVFLLERIINLITGSDISFNDRILTPIKYIPDILINHPFGIQTIHGFYESYTYGYVDLSSIMHNSIITLIYNYGILGVIALFFILFSAKDIYIRYAIFIMLMQNGNFLSIDKVVLVFLLVLLYNSSKRMKNKEQILYGK